MTEATTIQRRKNSALVALLGLSFLTGIVDAGAMPYLQTPQREFLLQIAANVTLLGVGFWWLHLDSVERNFRRSHLLDVGIVFAALLFVPYYFFRSRPRGSRAAPILAFVGLVLASMACTVAGMFVMTLVQGEA